MRGKRLVILLATRSNRHEHASGFSSTVYRKEKKRDLFTIMRDGVVVKKSFLVRGQNSSRKRRRGWVSFLPRFQLRGG